jgi:hypothetical protein
MPVNGLYLFTEVMPPVRAGRHPEVNIREAFMAARLLWAGVFLTVSTSAHALGSITMTGTGYPDSVVVNVTVNDTGGVPLCGWLTLLRNGQETFLYIEREPGATISRQLVDTNVEPNTLYCYTVAMRTAPFALTCPFGDLCDAFECFYRIETCVNTGPDPALIGHGRLSTQWPDGTPVDANEVQALLYTCTPPDIIALHSSSAPIGQYLDTNIDVKVYGTWWCCWAQGVWLLTVQAVEPQPCVLPVNESTWGKVKSLYRE